MSPGQRKRRAREIQDQIHEILLRDWDPIGVADVPECQDEYDAYVGGVYRLLSEGASSEDVAMQLRHVETVWLGIVAGTQEHLLEVARNLCALDVRM